MKNKAILPVQIEGHGKVVVMGKLQENFDHERAKRAEETIQFLRKLRKQSNLSQEDVDRLLVVDE